MPPGTGDQELLPLSLPPLHACCGRSRAACGLLYPAPPTSVLLGPPCGARALCLVWLDLACSSAVSQQTSGRTPCLSVGGHSRGAPRRAGACLGYIHMYTWADLCVTVRKLSLASSASAPHPQHSLLPSGCSPAATGRAAPSVGLVCVSLMTDDVEQLFVCFLGS